MAKQIDFEPIEFEEISEPKQSKNVLEALVGKISDTPETIVDTASSILPSMETVEDIATGGLQGMSLGFADEAIAGVRAGTEAMTGKDKSITDFPELYRQYQRLEQQKLEQAKERSPYAYMAGEVGGGIMSGLATSGAGLVAGGAPAAVKGLAPRAIKAAQSGAILGGITGAGTSKGELGSQEQIADVLGSAALGGVLGGGLSAAGDVTKAGVKSVGGKMDEFIKDSPLLRQMGLARKFGQSGIAVNEGEKAGNLISRQQTQDITEIVNKFKSARDKIGQEIGALVDDASDSGVKVNIKPEYDQIVEDLRQALEKNKLIFGTAEADKILNQLKRVTNAELTPSEAKTLKNQIYDMVGGIETPELRNPLTRFQKAIDESLNEAVPGLQELNTKYSTFLSSGPEMLLTKGQPSEFVHKFLSSLKEPDAKIAEATTELLSSLSVPGVKKQESRRIYTELIDKLGEFEKANPGLLTKLGIGKPEEFAQEILDKADKFAVFRQVLGYEPHGSPLGNMRDAMATSSSGTGRGKLIGAANLLGRAESAIGKSGPAKLSRSIYQAGNDQLNGIADKLQSSGIPGLESLGVALRKGLENKNAAMKNAALFTILQNPEARLLISPEDLNEDKTK